MTLFALPTGYRVALRLHAVGIAPPGRTVLVDRTAELDATATDHFEIINGELRRRFTDCYPPVNAFGDDLWMADDVSLDYSPSDDLAIASR